MNITKEVGKYLKEYFVEYVAFDLHAKNLDELEGEMRDKCFVEMSNLFDDAMDEFDVGDIIDEVEDYLNDNIKDLLFQRHEKLCDYKIENQIDGEIKKLEALKNKIREME